MYFSVEIKRAFYILRQKFLKLWKILQWGVTFIIRNIELIKCIFIFGSVFQVVCFVIHLCVGINSKVLLSTIRMMGRIENMWILAEWTNRRKPTEAQRLNFNGRISPIVDGSFQARIELRPSVLERCWLWRVDGIPPFIHRAVLLK